MRRHTDSVQMGLVNQGLKLFGVNAFGFESAHPVGGPEVHFRADAVGGLLGVVPAGTSAAKIGAGIEDAGSDLLARVYALPGLHHANGIYFASGEGGSHAIGEEQNRVDMV